MTAPGRPRGTGKKSRATRFTIARHPDLAKYVRVYLPIEGEYFDLEFGGENLAKSFLRSIKAKKVTVVEL